jgi:hypothetical protein
VRRFCYLMMLGSAALMSPGIGNSIHAMPLQESADQTMPCPGALAWHRDHRDDSLEAMAKRDKDRVFSLPALRAELAERYSRDQAARKAYLLNRHHASVIQYLRRIDSDNLAWFSQSVRKTGFPTVAMVGEAGVLHAWLLAQHADLAPEFQQALLPAVRQRYEQGELGGDYLARFVDRVLKARGEPQRYGTQYSPEEWQSPTLGLPDEQSLARVEQERSKLGIMPLADYVCMMRYERRPGAQQ